VARARGALTCLCVITLALTGARAGLGGIESSGEPIAVGATKPLFAGVTFAPGQSVVRTARIANGGDAAGQFVLSAVGAGELAGELRLTVSDGSGRIVYRGALLELDAAPLGILAPGETRMLGLAVELPERTRTQTAGLVADASFTWTATRA
jgi:hypothetical protein